MLQWVYLFGESSSDLSLWPPHIEVKKKEKGVGRSSISSTKLTKEIAVSLDLPIHVQHDFNLKKNKKGDGWQMEYLDTEWKEWMFHMGYNYYCMLYNPETRKFYLEVFSR